MRARALIFFAVGCGGDPFGNASDTGAELAGAPSSAGSIGSGGAGISEGGRAGMSSSGAATAAGSSSSAGEPAEGGAGGAAGASAEPAELVPCLREWSTPNTSNWRFAAPTTLPTNAQGRAVVADGDLSTRWVMPEPQATGQWFELSFIDPLTVGAIELRDTPGNGGAFVPSTLRLLISGEPVDALLEYDADADRLGISFEPRPATRLRLELTAAAEKPWAIAELGAFCEP